MIGGANDTENKKVKVVSEDDVDNAREKTIEVFSEKLEENIKKQLSESETFVLTSIDKEIISSDSSYAPGDIIDTFNYSVKEKVKVITFNQNDFQDLLKEKFDKEAENDFEFDKITQIAFQKDIADYEAKTLELTAEAKALYWPIIEAEEIKKNLTEKNNAEIKEYLGKLENISKAVITYKPAWLSTLPIKNQNIIIEEVK